MHNCAVRIAAALCNVIFECLHRRNYIEVGLRSSKICKELGHAFRFEQVVSYVIHCSQVFLAAAIAADMIGPLTLFFPLVGAVRCRILDARLLSKQSACRAHPTYSRHHGCSNPALRRQSALKHHVVLLNSTPCCSFALSTPVELDAK